MDGSDSDISDNELPYKRKLNENGHEIINPDKVSND